MTEVMQQALFQVEGVPVYLVDVPISKCVHSRFNTRKTRDADSVRRLAERMQKVGFERTRALWAVQQNGHYEVFAGGTRLEAARMIGADTVPLMLHAELTNEEISRRADLDNDSDEYHEPVSPVDVWAEYARLHDEEGWTQATIALAKGVTQSRVSERQKWAALPDHVKRFIQQKLLTEAHLREITSLSIAGCLGRVCAAAR